MEYPDEYIEVEEVTENDSNIGSEWKKNMKPIKSKMAELELKMKDCSIDEFKILSREYSQLQFKLEFMENMSSRFTRDKLKSSSEMRHLTQLQLTRLRVKN